jgi:hypothetical protein
MIEVGTKVKVKDNYSGGLDNVIGKTAKVVYVDVPEDDRVCTRLVLDIKGTRKYTRDSWITPGAMEDYILDHTVIVNSNEVDLVSFDFKDVKGKQVEIGDEVAYGPLGGGVIFGRVVDIDNVHGDRYGYSYSKVKVRLEIQDTHLISDGGDIRIEVPYKRYQWYSHGRRMVILNKKFSLGDLRIVL